MKCNDCLLKYKRQTDRTFHNRYNEQLQEISNIDCNSGYSNHILNTGHAFGSITDTIKVVKREKGKYLNTLKISYT
jgi:hypothetical protein